MKFKHYSLIALLVLTGLNIQAQAEPAASQTQQGAATGFYQPKKSYTEERDAYMKKYTFGNFSSSEFSTPFTSSFSGQIPDRILSFLFLTGLSLPGISTAAVSV